MKKITCTECNFSGKPEYLYHKYYNDLVCFGLFLLYIIPGLMYLIWGLSSRKTMCKKCGSTKNYVKY